MTTLAPVRPDPVLDTGDPLVAHYANKADILAATVEGVAIEALCGKVWVPSHNPDGLPVCPQCEIELERIKNIDRAQRRLN